MGAASLPPLQSSLLENQQVLLEHLWRDGFVVIKGLLPQQNIDRFWSACTDLIEHQPKSSWADKHQYENRFRVPVFTNLDWSVLSNLSGLSGPFDGELERLITHPELEPLLRAILGNGYKIWETSIRRSEATDDGLALHQDSRGEFGLSVLLQDIDGIEGTTVFLKGSHRFPVTSRHSGLDQINPGYLRRWLDPARGKKGDVCLFFKSVWHGRVPSHLNETRDAMLMSFVAAGYDYRAFDVSADILDNLPPVTRRQLNPQLDTALLPNGRRLILGGEEQPPRLIDAAYLISAWKPHPIQLTRPLGWIAPSARRVLAHLRSASASKH